MRNPLKRFYGRNDLHFITFSCYRRWPLLGSPATRDCFVKFLCEVRRKKRFLLFGYVVMPNHVHLLMSEPEGTNPAKVLQVLKQLVSRGLQKDMKGFPAGLLSANAVAALEAEHFWQRRFYDFNVWTEEKFWEKLEYMHANPMKNRLVAYPGEWPWSSWSHYAWGEEGLIPIDPLEKDRGNAHKLKKCKFKTRTLENHKGAAPGRLL